MFLVGLTGGIASGKSTVSEYLRDDCGCAVVDADVIAREVLLPGRAAYQAVVHHFGACIVNSDGTIDRNALAEIIFSNEKKRKTLNSITHKEIGKLLFWEILKYFLKGKRFVILDVPLLIESKFWLKFVRHVVVVYCDQPTQLHRLMSRNSYTKEEALKRINSQMSLEDKLKFASTVVDNSESIASTKLQVKDFYKKLEKSFSINLYELIIGLGLLGIVLGMLF